jgi:Ca2+-binding EF-hand superfamily protein
MSQVLKNTLQPKWMHGAHSFRLPVAGAFGIRIEVWDHDWISKDEFMGAGTIPLHDIDETARPTTRHLILEQRDGREGKDRVTGDLLLETHWMSEKFQKRLALRESDKADKADKLIKGVPKDTKLSIDKIKAAAEALIVSGHRGIISDRDQLRDVLEKLGIFNSVTALDALMWSDYESIFFPKEKADSAAVAEALRSNEVRDARAALFWEMLDLNRDGQIDFNELLMGLAMNTESDPAERAQFYFDQFDLNKDGELSAEEVFALQATCMKALTGAIRVALFVNLRRRAETKLYMSEEDLRKACDECAANIHKLGLAQRCTDYIFQTVDKDKNGVITKDEFLAFLTDKQAQQSLKSLIRTSLQELSEKNNKFMDEEFERAITRGTL